MNLTWLWLALGLAWLLNFLLLGWLVRLRLEVWANRRVIAALEAAAQQTEPKAGSNQSNIAGLLLWIVSLAQLLLFMRELWS